MVKCLMKLLPGNDDYTYQFIIKFNDIIAIMAISLSFVARGLVVGLKSALELGIAATESTMD